MSRSKIAITIGDPAGIGPEVVIKALCTDDVVPISDTLIVGDMPVIESALMLVNPRLNPKDLNILETGKIKQGDFTRGIPDSQCGDAALSYIHTAINLALKGEVSAIVTAPISKTSIALAGSRWKGHTEMLAELTNTDEYAMMLYGEPLRVILVTIHEAIKDIPRLLNVDNILKTIRLAQKGCMLFGIKSPKIAVSGLNPHSGEGGIFGTEESE
ncbi:MAG: 4-hydroxythreonine-4-phosphate dehydrogenase PdxA, partial [Thermodesulfovibrionales bacterium]